MGEWRPVHWIDSTSTMGRVFSDSQLAARRRAQDRALAVQQHVFDGFTAENTDKRGGWRVPKSARAQFAVVSASEAYRTGYDCIQW